MKPRRILMLTMEEHVPPDTTAGLRDHEIGAWKTEAKSGKSVKV